MSSKPELLEISPAQGMINFMLKYSFFHKQVIQIPASVTFTKKVDFELMKKAFNIEIERNDCMRLRFVKKGGKMYEYFLDEYRLDDIPVLTFKTSEEQEACLNADAVKTIHHLKGELFRVIFFNSFDGRQGIYINVSHLVMDGAAVFTFFSDLFAVYDALAEGGEMPKPLTSYKELVKKELKYIYNEERVNADKEFYTEFFRRDSAPIFNGVHGPELLEKARIKKKNPNLRVLASFDPIHDKAELVKKPVSKEDSEIILNYMNGSKASPECLVQLGMRLYLAKLNKSVNDGIIDTYFVTLCTRRKTLSDKRCGGTAASALPWRLILPRELTFEQAVRKLQDLQCEIFRHQDYPFTSWRNVESKLYGYGMADGASSMMFSWFPLEENTMNGWDYEFNGYCMGRYVMPLYTYAMKDASTGTLRFSYLHRTDTLSTAHIEALHENSVKALKLGCSNPDLTVGEIFDMI